MLDQTAALPPDDLRRRRTVTVVNENDEFIEYKAWMDLLPGDIHRSSYLWVTNSRGHILIAQRALTMSHNGGKWSTAATGTVIIGEDYESNIYDEAEEEIRLTGVQFDLGPKILIRLPKGSHYVQWFTAVVDWQVEWFKLDRAEVEAVRWVHPRWLVRDVRRHPTKYAPAVPIWLPEILSWMEMR